MMQIKSKLPFLSLTWPTWSVNPPRGNSRLINGFLGTSYMGFKPLPSNIRQADNDILGFQLHVILRHVAIFQPHVIRSYFLLMAFQCVRIITIDMWGRHLSTSDSILSTKRVISDAGLNVKFAVGWMRNFNSYRGNY